MRIAQISPLAESVPPRAYGGTERVVSYLTEELVRLGHDVTLFASGDSATSAALIGCCPLGLRELKVIDYLCYTTLQLELVRRQVHQFDVLHFHIDYVHFPLCRELGNKTITTLHGRLDIPELAPVYRTFPEMPLVSISRSQRAPMPPVNWIANIYHGLPPTVCQWVARPKRDYLAFLGRISPEKRPDRAIAIAQQAGIKLKIAAKVDRADEAYFQERIKPLLNDPQIEYLGEIGEHEKSDFLGNALALIFPIDWPEPFGLNMIEAMSCGTPVIAWNCGSVQEVVDHGITGYIVSTIDEAVHRVADTAALNRENIRKRFALRFSAERMAQEYLIAYNMLTSLSSRAA